MALGIYVVLRALSFGVHGLSYMEWASSVVVACRFSCSTGMWDHGFLTRRILGVPFEEVDLNYWTTRKQYVT